MSASEARAPALALERITCIFPAADRIAPAYTAVRELSLQVAPGEFVSIVGPTGCGKSTLLNVAAGLLAPSAGTVRVAGEPLRGLNRRAGYLSRRKRCCPGGAHERTWPRGSSSAASSAATPCKGPTSGSGASASRASATTIRISSPAVCAGASLAQTLILDPAIVLMDEPFSALDVQTRQLMENELLDLWSADRKSVVFITHDLEEAISLSDRVVVLSAGPATRAIGEFVIGLARPRDVAEVRLTRGFLELHREIWELLKAEVLKGHAQIQRA